MEKDEERKNGMRLKTTLSDNHKNEHQGSGPQSAQHPIHYNTVRPPLERPIRKKQKPLAMDIDDWINLAFGFSIIALPIFLMFHSIYAPGKWIYEKVAEELAKEKEEINRKKQEEKRGTLINAIYYEPPPIVEKRPRLQR